MVGTLRFCPPYDWIAPPGGITMNTPWTRRRLLTGAAAAGTTLIVKQARSADFKFVQYHNQAEISTLHKNLAAGDPAALKMLIAGEIQFFTLMGGIIGTVVPMAEVQQVPFAFRSAAEAHKAIDSPLGAYMGEEMAAKGMYLFPVAGFDNGMRQVTTVTRPVNIPGDLAGVKIRVPPGQMIFDTFQAFGAEPVTTSANLIYDAIKTGKVGAQENPLAILENFRIYEVVKYVSMTNHMWSGFNQMAHLAMWRGLPDDIKDVITRNVTKYVRQQRIDQSNVNASLRDKFIAAGLVFNEVDQAPFRSKLANVYATWKDKLGSKCWALLEAEIGKLG